MHIKMFAVVFALFLFSPVLKAACELTDEGAKTYRVISVARCADEPGSYCIEGLRVHQSMVVDRQYTLACGSDGRACSLQGEIFSSRYFLNCERIERAQSAKPVCKDTVSFEVYARENNQLLAKCRDI